MKHDVMLDDASEQFETYEEMSEFLRELDDDSEWVTMEVKQTSVNSIEKDEIIPGVTDTVFEDTAVSGTGLFLTTLDRDICIGESAIDTIKDRAAIYGAGLNRVSRQTRADIFTECLKKAPGSGILRVSGDKVRAYLSSGYRPIAQPAIYRAAAATVRGYEDNRFLSGFWNHRFTCATWDIRDADVAESYAKILTKSGVPDVDESEVNTTVSVCTSDVGLSGVIVWYDVSVKGTTLNLGNGLHVNHRGDADIESVKESLRDSFSGYKRKYYDIEALGDIPIRHPKSCVFLLLKRSGIPENIAKEAAVRFDEKIGSGVSDGMTVYIFGVNEALNIAKERGLDMKKIFSYREKIARIIGYDFKRYDREAGVSDI